MKLWYLTFFLFLLLFACQPDIGSPCLLGQDCFLEPVDGIFCDTASPDGYCTIANCLPNTCPQEAMCVSFRDGDFTFCMAACSSDAECREGYVCLTDSPDSGTVFVDSQSRNDGATGYCGVP